MDGHPVPFRALMVISAATGDNKSSSHLPGPGSKLGPRPIYCPRVSGFLKAWYVPDIGGAGEGRPRSRRSRAPASTSTPQAKSALAIPRRAEAPGPGTAHRWQTLGGDQHGGQPTVRMKKPRPSRSSRPLPKAGQCQRRAARSSLPTSSGCGAVRRLVDTRKPRTSAP